MAHPCTSRFISCRKSYVLASVHIVGRCKHLGQTQVTHGSKSKLSDYVMMYEHGSCVPYILSVSSECTVELHGHLTWYSQVPDLVCVVLSALRS